MPPETIKQGGVYYVDGVPDENGGNPKSRRLIVLQDHGGSDYISMCGASSTPQKDGAIPVPNRSTNPSCRSGFPGPTWAVPTWLIDVHHSLVLADNYQGYLRKATIIKIVEAAADAAAAGLASRQKIDPPI